MRNNEARLDSGFPFIKTSSNFPLKSLYKKHCRILRVVDGQVYSYDTPDTMSIYLYLRYGKLYLKWVFVEDEQKLKLYGLHR